MMMQYLQFQIQIQLANGNMLGQRRRFNYLMEDYQRKSRKENVPVAEDVADNKRIQQLQIRNRKLTQDTAMQFKKFQDDLEHVEDILQEKEKVVESLKQQNIQIEQHRKVLAQASEQKDLIIMELESKLREVSLMLEQKQKIQVKETSQGNVQTDDIERAERQIQTQQYLQESKEQQTKVQECFKEKYLQTLNKAVELEEEVYKYKEQLFTVTSELNLVRQEFSSYKLLKDIQNIQNQ